MTETEFLAQAMALGEDRWYAPNWPYVVFKARYGRWATKAEKAAAIAAVERGEASPTPELMEWLSGYWREAFPAR